MALAWLATNHWRVVTVPTTPPQDALVRSDDVRARLTTPAWCAARRGAELRALVLSGEAILVPHRADGRVDPALAPLLDALRTQSVRKRARTAE